ncbi:hypothetical protein SCHPADRAFT_904198 [Schizopora paradoxa]|uniref:Uncharacterized protein n=1 Tax=Schizopora paradoxa TaxID=27342 RepID=A0A0H2RVP3_9AGAM|nr:hypothetical protein SCHPADRAFT_904198 [Schizopora paradoxa]
MGKNKSGHGAVLAEVERALVLKAIEIGGHVRNINDAAASVLHILQTSLQVPGSSSQPHTVEQWSNIETKVRDTALGIRKLSSKNEARLNDALRSFRTYLASDEDPTSKAKELEIYKKELLNLGTLTQGSLSAYFETLKGVQKDITKFKRHWPGGEDTDYARRVRPSIIGIERAIQQIINEEEDIRDQNFLPTQVAAILTPITFLLPSMEAQAMHSLIEGEIHSRVEVVVNVGGLEHRQARKFNPLCCLIDVGRLLYADMEDLQAQYEDSYRQKDFEVYKRRFNSIIHLYGSLEGALHAFGTACYKQAAITASGACGKKTAGEMSRELDTHSVDRNGDDGVSKEGKKKKKKGFFRGLFS